MAPRIVSPQNWGAGGAETLADRILHPDTLRFAWKRVEANQGKAGADGVSIARFRLRLDANLLALADEVRAGAYLPGPVRRRPVFTGTKLRTISALLARFVAEAVPDPATARLLTAWIAPPRRDGRPPRPRGIPLGAPVSPLLCNLYLHHLDRSLRRRSWQTVRYADDFVLLCQSERHAERGLRATEKVLRGLELALHPTKTRLVSFDDGFDFLGVHFAGSDYSYQVDGKRITIDTLPPDFFHYHADGYE